MSLVQILGSSGALKKVASATTDNFVSSSSDNVAAGAFRANSASGPALQVFHKSNATYPAYEFKGGAIAAGPGTGPIDTTMFNRISAGLVGMQAGISVSSMPQGVSPLSVAGTKPVAVAGTGTNAQPITVTAGAGGNNTVSGGSGGAGGNVTVAAGQGGLAAAGSFNGNGGNITLTPGAAGTGGGGGIEGNLILTRGQIVYGGDITMYREVAKKLRLDGRMRIFPNLLTGESIDYGLHIAATDPATGFLGAGGTAKRFTNLMVERNYRRTDPESPDGGTTPANINTPYVGISSVVNYGVDGGTVAAGSGFAMSASQVIANSQHNFNEHCAFYGAIRYENNSIGSAWFTDWSTHSGGLAQRLLSGVNMYMSKHYAAEYPTAPVAKPSVAFTATTWPGRGGSSIAEYDTGGANSTTYPMEIGFHVTGRSGAIASPQGAGWRVGFKVGGAGVWTDNTIVQTGVEVNGYQQYGLYISGQAAAGLSSTRKAIYVPAGAGEAHFADGIIIKTKAGIPTTAEQLNAVDGHLIIDNTNHNLYFRSGGQMRVLSGGAPPAVDTDQLLAVDEVFDSVHRPSVVDAGVDVRVAVFTCKLPLNVMAASVVSMSSGASASDTNFWTVRVRRVRAGTATVIATKTTQVTGGSAILTAQDWSFVGGYANQGCQTGDIVEISFTPTGAAPTLTDVACTIRWEPV